MPQLETSTYLSQIFWLSICFVFLLFFSNKVTLPRLGKILYARWLEIEGKRETAEKLTQQAYEIQQKVEAQLQEIRQNSQDELLKMAHTISLETEKNKAEITSRFRQQFRSNEQTLNKQKNAAMIDIEKVAHALTQEIIEKLSKKISSSSLTFFENEDTSTERVH